MPGCTLPKKQSLLRSFLGPQFRTALSESQVKKIILKLFAKSEKISSLLVCRKSNGSSFLERRNVRISLVGRTFLCELTSSCSRGFPFITVIRNDNFSRILDYITCRSHMSSCVETVQMHAHKVFDR